MSKSISAALKQHLEGEVTTLAWLVKVTRSDSTVLAFCTYDKDITIDGVTYKANSAFTPTAIDSNIDMNVDNLDIEGFLDDSAITEEDIDKGLYDSAQVVYSICNWADVSMGALILKTGHIGNITRTNKGKYTAEIRGMHEKMQKQIGRLYTTECDAIFGSARCGFNIASVTESRTVSTVTDRRTFTANTLTSGEDNYYKYGKLVFTSGNNAGQIFEVKKSTASSGEVVLFLPAGVDIEVGDSFDITAGCDKRKATCRDKFSNLVNFQGFPNIPSQSFLTGTPEAK